ncbi:Uncharacterized protein MJ0374, partial [Durusdinium trenchii]
MAPQGTRKRTGGGSAGGSGGAGGGSSVATRRRSSTAELAAEIAADLAADGSELAQRSKKILKRYWKESSLHLNAIEDQFWHLDEQLCTAVHQVTKQNWALKVVCSLLSLTGDEALWFILPVVIGSALAVWHGGPVNMPCAAITCEMEFFLDLFGGMAVCAVVEQTLKCFFQRPRPSCRAYDNSHCCVWGEWYSFPSGHSMRALYAFNWMFYGTHALTLLRLPLYLEPFVLVWALGVGYARVAAGRHHPIDVVVGDFVGLAVSRLVENDISDRERALAKIFCGVLVAVQVWFLLLLPMIRQGLESKLKVSKPLAAAVAGVIGLAYFAFYSAALLSVLDIFTNQESGLLDLPEATSDLRAVEPIRYLRGRHRRHEVLLVGQDEERWLSLTSELPLVPTTWCTLCACALHTLSSTAVFPPPCSPTNTTLAPLLRDPSLLLLPPI